MNEVTFKAWRYKKAIDEFRDYLLYMSLRPEVRQNDQLYKELCRLIIKYEEHFEFSEVQ